jgi:hypothetical protein
MTKLDDAALKAEIDHISQKIDAIMKKVDQLYPSQTESAGREKAVSQDKPLTSPDPTG